MSKRAADRHRALKFVHAHSAEAFGLVRSRTDGGRALFHIERMLHEFLTENRTALIQRCQHKGASRPSPAKQPAAPHQGIPQLLDQLAQMLRTRHVLRPPEDDDAPCSEEQRSQRRDISRSAALHGHELLTRGFTIEQVVHNYGDLCQAITELALETAAPIGVDEFKILNRCLDDAIAGAVTEFSAQRDALMTEKGLDELNLRQGFLAHELRNRLHTATLAIIAIKAGKVGLHGATGAILEQSLIGLGELIDRSISEVRSEITQPLLKRIPLAALIAEICATAELDPRVAERQFAAAKVDRGLAVDVDRALLLAAIWNLLDNALKFTPVHGKVSIDAYATGDRIHIDVSDRCGGLPPGAESEMFRPFNQSGADRSGLGLGLVISRRGIQACKGVLRVRDMPGSGCIFTIDLPRHDVLL